ncbi:MAG: hypothetical protein COV36_01880 [Alphaproteobacteria bacterium CG11_big_fil_rev_8_21_14_0_20_44_7]|nr:MAG: hypothetical protein COV36_01880 [Alphaproteobacteria bacterium CG11_big_fil_rev_8_21_14_0_20_44_7]
MDYYVVINGQKQGPFDIIAIIKKVKTRQIAPDTLVADAANGNFMPATSFPEIATLLEEQVGINKASQMKEKRVLRLRKVLADGVDLWVRNVIGFTVGFATILIVAFALNGGLKKIQIFADYPSIGNYIISLLATTLYLLFFGYILNAKRSKAFSFEQTFIEVKKGLIPLGILSAIFSLYTIAFGVNQLVGLVSVVVLLFVVTMFSFVPFLIVDTSLGLGGAAKQSLKKVMGMGADNFGVILALIAINLVVALAPAFIDKNFFIFGLFLSMPITVSSLAYIYDELFA